MNQVSTIWRPMSYRLPEPAADTAIYRVKMSLKLGRQNFQSNRRECKQTIGKTHKPSNYRTIELIARELWLIIKRII